MRPLELIRKIPHSVYEAAIICDAAGKRRRGARSSKSAPSGFFPWYGDSAMEIADINIRANDTGPETLRLARLAAEFGILGSGPVAGHSGAGSTGSGRAARSGRGIFEIDPASSASSPKPLLILDSFLRSRVVSGRAVESFRTGFGIG